ncbi:hypothetical protein QQ73_07105, partial [Candidatus Endoriftia persephone str. Guaymas]|nr:hypothetical protein [Candidatus Endoriftia persephone str. Guaymas]
EHCEKKFAVDPSAYLKDKEMDQAAEQEHADAGSCHSCQHDHAAKDVAYPPVAGAVYTCPMHPEIQEAHPGPCPKCGMALEPMGEPVAVTRTEYTCPMHPEIVQDHPDNCPKCGMALEPRTIEVEEKNEELIDMNRRFWVSAMLALPL